MMGKRQIGDMQPSELVITILLSEVAAIPMQSNSIPLVYGVLSIGVLVSMEVFLSFLSVKSPKFSKMLAGNPCVIITNGVIDEKELYKLRLSVEDVYEEMRLQGIDSLDEVSYAVFETNGQMSILQREGSKAATRADVGKAEEIKGDKKIPMPSGTTPPDSLEEKIDLPSVGGSGKKEYVVISNGVINSNLIKKENIDVIEILNIISFCNISILDISLLSLDNEHKIIKLIRR